MSQDLLLLCTSQRDAQGIRCWYLFIRFFLISSDDSKQDDDSILFYSILHQSICIKAVFSRSYDDYSKYKEKVPDVSDPNQDVEKKCNSKLTFT